MGSIIKTKAGKIFVSILFVLICISFIGFGISDVIVSLSTPDALRVGDKKYSQAQVQAIYDRELEKFSDNNPGLELDSGLRVLIMNDFLRREINDNLLISFVEDVGIDFSNSYVDYLAGELNLNIENRFRKEFSDNLKRQISFLSLGSRVKELPRIYKDVMNKVIFQKRDISVYKLGRDSVELEKAIDKEDLKIFYDAHSSDFLTPETRNFEVLQTSLEDIKSEKKFKVSDEEVKGYYNKNIGKYKSDQQRHVFRLNFNGMAEAKEAKLSLQSSIASYFSNLDNKVAGLVDQVQEKSQQQDEADLQDIYVKLLSESGFKSADTSLGLLSNDGTLDAKISPFIFSSEGNVSGVYEDGEIFSLFVYSFERAEVVRAIAEVRQDIVSEIEDQKAVAEFNSLFSSLRQKFLNRYPLKDIFDEFSADNKFLKFARLSSVAKDSQKLLNYSEFDKDKLFASEFGKLIDPIVSSDEFSFFDLTKVKESEIQPFDKVENKVLQLYRQDLVLVLLESKADELFVTLKALEKQSDSSAKISEKAVSLGLAKRKYSSLVRTIGDTSISPKILNQVFRQDKQILVKYKDQQGDFLFIMVDDVVYSKEGGNEEYDIQLEAFLDSFKQSLENNTFTGFVDSLKQDHDVYVNHEIINNITGQASP